MCKGRLTYGPLLAPCFVAVPAAHKKRVDPAYDGGTNPSKSLVPGTRIELVQGQAPRDFKSLASTNSATQANVQYLYFKLRVVKGLLLPKTDLPRAHP